jgi:hypothetical protein
VTAPVPDAVQRAALLARIATLEVSLRLTTEVVDRLRGDVVQLDECAVSMEGELRELRNAVDNRS